MHSGKVTVYRGENTRNWFDIRAELEEYGVWPVRKRMVWGILDLSDARLWVKTSCFQ